MNKDVKSFAFANMRSIDYTDADAAECFQLSSINLWKALCAQPIPLCERQQHGQKDFLCEVAVCKTNMAVLLAFTLYNSKP